MGIATICDFCSTFINEGSEPYVVVDFREYEQTADTPPQTKEVESFTLHFHVRNKDGGECINQIRSAISNATPSPPWIVAPPNPISVPTPSANPPASNEELKQIATQGEPLSADKITSNS